MFIPLISIYYQKLVNIHLNSSLFHKLELLEMDPNDDLARIMEDIIHGGNGSNNVPTYTDEERSKADRFLNIPAAEDGDTGTDDGEISTDDGDTGAEDDDNAEGSAEVRVDVKNGMKFLTTNT